MTELWSLEDELGTVVMKNMYRTGSFVINFSDGSKQVNQEECFQTTQVVQILNDLVSNEESRAKPQNYRLSHSSLVLILDSGLNSSQQIEFICRPNATIDFYTQKCT